MSTRAWLTALAVVLMALGLWMIRGIPFRWNHGIGLFLMLLAAMLWQNARARRML